MSGAIINMCRAEEDERIEIIGQVAMRERCAEFMVDGDAIEKGKADRYVRKLRERFPRLVETERYEDTPVPNVTTVRVVVSDG